MHMVVMKPNNTVDTWFECVVFSEEIGAGSDIGRWEVGAG